MLFKTGQRVRISTGICLIFRFATDTKTGTRKTSSLRRVAVLVGLTSIDMQIAPLEYPIWSRGSVNGRVVVATDKSGSVKALEFIQLLCFALMDNSKEKCCCMFKYCWDWIWDNEIQIIILSNYIILVGLWHCEACIKV